MSPLRLGILLLGAALGLAATGCKTESYCFGGCNGGAAGGSGLTGSDSGSTTDGPHFGGNDTGCTGLGCTEGGGGGNNEGGGPCIKTNNGIEICDGLDNDCDGNIDEPKTAGDPQGVDFSDPLTCGNCSTNCTAVLQRALTPVCKPPASGLGRNPGTCDYKSCDKNFYDVDGDRTNGCEYYCQYNPDGKNTKDLGGVDGCGKDDDCDGKTDEDVNTCTDVENCGVCGKKCTVLHGTAKCVSTGTGTGCTDKNTSCAVAACDTDFYDVNGSPDDGCEYGPCTKTGAEKCDGIDNDCDGQIDNVDPDIETGPDGIGDDCFGSPKGLCAEASHKGVKKCIGGVVECCDVDSNNVTGNNPEVPDKGLRNQQCAGNVGPFVLKPDVISETCNGVDDDCDGAVDDNPTDAGGVCGSSVGECKTGTKVCDPTTHALVCGGFTGPQTDVCDGKDNDCDGVIDGAKPANAVTCTNDASCANQVPNIWCRLSSNGTKYCVAPPEDIAAVPCSADSDCTSEAPNTACRAQTGNASRKYCVPPAMTSASSTGLEWCDVPTPPPCVNSSGTVVSCATAGATPVATPCHAGVYQCTISANGVTRTCSGSATAPSGVPDQCSEDSNCDGQLTDQNGLQNSDPKNCGTCGNDCSTLGAHGNWECQSGQCVRNGCLANFIECGGANPDDCEKACTFVSSTETCNGQDDDCNCLVDDNITTTPTPVQVCGVSPAATEAGCTTGITLTCTGSGWDCTFPQGYCDGTTCATTTDICDGIDNDCNGVADQAFKPPALSQGFLGQGCFSDDGKPPPGDGPCRTIGVFVCNTSGSGTECNAVADTSKQAPEVCDGVDNDCNGTADDAVAGTADPQDATHVVGQPCFGGTLGECADVSHQGTWSCVSGAVICAGQNLLYPNQAAEICDGKDNDCDGGTDESGPQPGGIDGSGDPANPTHKVGALCGSGVGACVPGNYVCGGGVVTCQGGSGPQPETCNGVDDNCNNTPDDNPTDVGGDCNVPLPKPGPTAQCPSVTQPCSKGTTGCTNGSPTCDNSTTPSPGAVDGCCDDTNCDGVLTNQPDFATSTANCGGCGKDCMGAGPFGHAGTHSTWDCVSSACNFVGCNTNYYDLDGDKSCEYFCPYGTNSVENCNGVDDDCDGTIDGTRRSPKVSCTTNAQCAGFAPFTSCLPNNQGGSWCSQPVANVPSPAQVCDAASSTDPKCGAGNGTTGILVSCTGGKWSCTYPQFYCTAGGSTPCRSTTDTCDNRDNNCNGAFDEAFTAGGGWPKPLNQSCTSEDLYRDLGCPGSNNPLCPPRAPPHGACIGTSGTYQCTANGTDTQCTSTYQAGNASQELCDNVDNDCDGATDETFNSPGTNASFVKPAVVRLGLSTNIWIYKFEASRPTANGASAGSGNGYGCNGACPAGVPPVPASVVTQDKTPSCSVQNRIPWFNVTPVEAEETCDRAGGHVCTLTDWQRACQVPVTNCTWGYAPLTSCKTTANYAGTPFCNLAQYDFDAAGGDQDGLLPTGSGALQNCWAEWGASLGQVMDITGNLREITEDTSNSVYRLMGGAFNTQVETGAACSFTFYSVQDSFKYFDTGFRCCFTSNPD